MSFHISRFIVPTLLLFVVALLALGCSDDSAPRSVVTVESVNGNEILYSDVYHNGDDGIPGTDDDFIVEDRVAIVLRNRPHDSGLSINPNGPFGAVTIHRFEIRFQGDETLAPLFGALHLRVASNQTVQGELPVIPASYKAAPPLSMLRTQGGELRFTAQVTLFGMEQDSNEEVVVSFVLPVHCANWGDD